MSSPGQIPYIFESKRLSFLFISDVDGHSGTGEADSHLLIHASGLNPEQLRVGKIPLFSPISELDVHFLHILVYAQSDRTWSCDKSIFIEGKNIQKLIR